MKFKCTNFYSYFEHIGSRGNQKKQLRLNSLTIVSPKIGRDTVQILAWDVTAGKHETIMTDSGMQLLHMASKGRLRLAHQIITQALHIATLRNMNHLPDEILQQSIEELRC